MNHEKWIRSLKVGDVVCDCRYQHVKILSISITGSGDRVLDLEGDFSCSARHCCSPPDHEHWFVYLLQCKDKSLYTGITNNLYRRIDQHNKGKGAKYTKGRTPVKLKHYLMCDSKSQALKLEYKIKQLNKTNKVKFFKEFTK